jgi:hypothetical protein
MLAAGDVTAKHGAGERLRGVGGPVRFHVRKDNPDNITPGL